MTRAADLKRELELFWRTRTFGHEMRRADDLEIVDAEFADLPTMHRNVLRRAGFSCRVQVASCPDWLLASIRGLGSSGARRVRAAIPQVNGDRIWDYPCPGRAINARRYHEVMAKRRQNNGRVELA